MRILLKYLVFTRKTMKLIRGERIDRSDTIEFIPINLIQNTTLPFYASRVSAGFPSPADEHLEFSISINEIVATNPNSTFFVRVNGDSMIEAPIPQGAILAVDKAVKAEHNDIVVCYLDGEFTVKRLMMAGKEIWLKPENRKYPPIAITPEMDFRVWGVVVTVVYNPKDI